MVSYKWTYDFQAPPCRNGPKTPGLVKAIVTILKTYLYFTPVGDIHGCLVGYMTLCITNWSPLLQVKPIIQNHAANHLGGCISGSKNLIWTCIINGFVLASTNEESCSPKRGVGMAFCATAICPK